MGSPFGFVLLYTIMVATGESVMQKPYPLYTIQVNPADTDAPVSVDTNLTHWPLGDFNKILEK